MVVKLLCNEEKVAGLIIILFKDTIKNKNNKILINFIIILNIEIHLIFSRTEEKRSALKIN